MVAMKFIGLLSVTFAVSAVSDSALLPFTFNPLPLGSIKPQGWLQDQMQLMSDGLAGNEYDFYDYVHQSSWLGGDQEYSDLNEGFPYWFNGLVPLAYGLDDERLKSQVRDAANYVLSHQADDGWIGPETGEHRILWGRFPAMLGFMQMAEADPTMQDTVVAAMHRFAELMHTMLQNNNTGYLGTGDDLWGRARDHDMMISLQWLYDNYPQNNSQILLDNMNMLNDAGYDWAYWYLDAFIKVNLYDVPDSITTPLYQFEHGVNAGQGLKAGAVVRRFTHNDTLLQSTRQGVDWSFMYHGSSSGSILGDERIDGLSPMTGSELCTAVETMYSLSYLYQAMGDNSFADRCELAAFNALPGAVTSDWWAHQYMSQPNQPYSKNLSETPFYNVNTLGQTFGLEPNYPCCTVNHPQGYPKFLSASFVKIGDNGLGHALLSPSTVSTTLAQNNNVSISCNTNYPFELTLEYTIEADKAFNFYVRVPSWSTSSTIRAKGSNDFQRSLHPDSNTGMAQILLLPGISTLTYTLGADTHLETRANNTIAVHRGPLLFSLAIGEEVISLPPKSFSTKEPFPVGYAPPQCHDHEMYNTTAWNIAIDPSTLKYNYKTNSTGLANPIWALYAPPNLFTVQGCEINWPIEKGVPTNPPADRTCVAPAAEYTLVPYGSARLHMVELPVMNLTMGQ